MYRMDDRPTHPNHHTQPAPTNSYSPSRTRLQQPPEQPLTTYQPLRDRSPYQFDDRTDYGPNQPIASQTAVSSQQQPLGYPMSAKERDRYVREYVPNSHKEREYGPDSSSKERDHGDAAPRHKPSSLKRKKGVNDPQDQKRYSQPLEGVYDSGIDRYSAPLDGPVSSGRRPLDVSYNSAAGDPNRGPFDISYSSTGDDPSRYPMGDQPYGVAGDQSRGPLDISYSSAGNQCRPTDYSGGSFAIDIDPALSTKTQRSHRGGHGSIPIYRTDSQEREERSHPKGSIGRSKSAENRYDIIVDQT